MGTVSLKTWAEKAKSETLYFAEAARFWVNSDKSWGNLFVFSNVRPTKEQRYGKHYSSISMVVVLERPNAQKNSTLLLSTFLLEGNETTANEFYLVMTFICIKIEFSNFILPFMTIQKKNNNNIYIYIFWSINWSKNVKFVLSHNEIINTYSHHYSTQRKFETFHTTEAWFLRTHAADGAISLRRKRVDLLHTHTTWVMLSNSKGQKTGGSTKKGQNNVDSFIVSEGSPVTYQCHLALQLITMTVGHL